MMSQPGNRDMNFLVCAVGKSASPPPRHGGETGTNKTVLSICKENAANRQCNKCFSP